MFPYEPEGTDAGTIVLKSKKRKMFNHDEFLVKKPFETTCEARKVNVVSYSLKGRSSFTNV